MMQIRAQLSSGTAHSGNSTSGSYQGQTPQQGPRGSERASPSDLPLSPGSLSLTLDTLLCYVLDPSTWLFRDFTHLTSSVAQMSHGSLSPSFLPCQLVKTATSTALLTLGHTSVYPLFLFILPALKCKNSRAQVSDCFVLGPHPSF